tara:strand:+ start:402 stop:665 length:264 start_codon:yes stop_codon:yes gene_type:complete
VDENEIRDLKDALVRLTMTIERMSDKQDEMLEDVKKIKEAIYNPDQGLYARLRDLEQWQNNVSRVLWTGGLAVLGLLMNSLYSALFT